MHGRFVTRVAGHPELKAEPEPDTSGGRNGIAHGGSDAHDGGFSRAD